MKDITKLIRRFVGILLLSTVLVIVLNIIILAAISASQTANGRPWTTAKETAEALQKTETGYILSGDMTERLSGENAKMDWSLSAIRKTDIGNICLRVGIMISSKTPRILS